MGIGRFKGLLLVWLASRRREVFYVVGGVRRSWRLHGCVCSDKAPLTVEERAVNLLAPVNIPSSEKIYYRKPQLRREPRSPEESTSSYKACLRRSWRLDRCGSSDKDPLTEEERATNLPPPANIPSQEETYCREPQLR